MIQIDGVNYVYQNFGLADEHIAQSEGKRPLLFLHGFTGSSANWQTHMKTHAPQRQTIAIDLLGHGGTDAPTDPTRYRMEQSAQDLATLLDQIAIKPVDLVGYSMGGRLALYFALAYPAYVNCLFLESTSPGLATASERTTRRVQDEAVADFIEDEGILAFVDRWEAIPLFASQQHLPTETKRRLREQRLNNNAKGLANSLRGMGTGVQPSLWSRLGELQMPVHLLVGELDIKFCAIGEAMVERFNQAGKVATLTVAPDAGHTVHLEQPAFFDQWIHTATYDTQTL